MHPWKCMLSLRENHACVSVCMSMVRYFDGLSDALDVTWNWWNFDQYCEWRLCRLCHLRMVHLPSLVRCLGRTAFFMHKKLPETGETAELWGNFVSEEKKRQEGQLMSSSDWIYSRCSRLKETSWSILIRPPDWGSPCEYAASIDL